MKTSDGTTVLLDSNLSVSRVHVSETVKKILSGVIRQAIVRPNGFFYRVDFGFGIVPQYHIVSHDLFCSCTLEQECPSIVAVRMFLRDGGKPAMPPLPGYFPVVPHVCLVCGAKAYYYPKLTSRQRGLGWSCEEGGTYHYWQHQIAVLRAAFEKKWGNQNID